MTCAANGSEWRVNLKTVKIVLKKASISGLYTIDEGNLININAFIQHWSTVFNKFGNFIEMLKSYYFRRVKTNLTVQRIKRGHV